MKVFITGATGLIGAHTTLELLNAGHDVRLLVRDINFARNYYSKQGYLLDDFVEADMLDTEAVREGLKGCDAVVHCAAMVSLDYKLAEEIYRNNVQGIKSVLGAAHKLGINKLIYVSSVSALFDPHANTTNAFDALPDQNDPYARSKIACEEYARNMQAQGVPLCMTYPAMVVGPNDPKLTTSNEGMLEFIKLMIPKTSSGLQMVDARDIAILHRKLLEIDDLPEPEECRYTIAGNFHTWPQVVDIFNDILLKPVRTMHCPGWLLRLTGFIMDFIKNVKPHNLPITIESTNLVTRWNLVCDDAAVSVMGRPLRPTNETVAETLAWAIGEGHVKAALR